MIKVRNSVQQQIDQLRAGIEEFVLDISSVRSRKELVKILHAKLADLIGFHDVSISLADNAGGTHTNFIYHSAVGREQKENFSKFIKADYPISDGFFNVTLNSEFAVLWNLSEILTWKSVPEYLKYAGQYGVKKILGISLKSVHSNLGCLFFFSEDQNAFSPLELGIVRELANQISVALTNIVFVEEIEKREREKEILLDLITIIASIRDRGDFDKVADEHVKKVISFNDMGILVLNADKSTHKIYIKNFEKERKIPKEFSRKLNQGKCSIRDGLLDVILNAHYPMVWIIEEVMKWENVPLYIKLWSEHGMKKVVGTPIRSRGEALGAILFFSKNIDSFQPEDLSKINAIANQLSVAVLNILTHEEMQKRENEKELLLSLSNDIAAIRNKTELLSVVKEKLKVLLPFNDLFVTVLNQDPRYHRTFIYDYEPKRSGHKDFDRLIKSQYPVEDGLISVTMQANNPVTFVIDEMMKNDFIPEYLAYYHQMGVKEVVGVAMRNGVEEVGAFFMMSEQEHAFTQQHLSLIKSISSQLCIVISNIIANDIIIERERDVSVLLTFSNEISTVKDRIQLEIILQNNIRRLIPFTKMAIIIYDDENQHHQSFFSPVEKRFPYTLLVEENQIDYELAVELLNQTRLSNAPVVFSVEDLRKRKVLKSLLEPDQKEFIGIAMYNSGQLLGGLFLFAEKGHVLCQKDYGMIQGIADQLSFTVFNILTHEKNVKREDEKTILLEMSKDIAKVRNKYDLHRIVNEKLKRLMPFSHTLTVKLDEYGRNAIIFLESQEANNGGNAELLELMKKPIPVNDGILDLVLSAERPVIFDLDQLVVKPRVPQYILLNHKLGIKELIVSPFSDSKRITGLLAIFCTEKKQIDNNHLNLIQGLSSQLSVAMSNIVANEKIERQIVEISGFKHQLEVENHYLQEEISISHNYSEIIGGSSAMNEVFHLIGQVSETHSLVLLLGETGTGKELIARAIHNTSLRRDKLMVKVNCATLPANLIESELFGHERGSFTGATDKRIGKFELANNSTLFLDEIGELPLDLQAKLLRVLQEKEIERVGGRSVIKVDVRVIAATNRDLAKEVKSGNFRKDLFFRLNVFPITIPPLRDRKDDITKLAIHFLEKHAKKLNKKIVGFSGKAIKELMAYDWPGNVREIEHLIERTILLATQPIITHLHLPLPEVYDSQQMRYHQGFKTIDEIEREHIIAVLKSCNGKVAGGGGAAEILRIPATTLHSKMKRLGIGKKFSLK